MMEKATAIMVLSFIGLFTVFSLADGCKCNIEHPQQRFCTSSFAFVGKITEIEFVDVEGLNFMRYIVEFSRPNVFKGNELLSRDRFNQIILTPYHGSLCGRSNLRRGVTYLLSGTVENDHLMISYCDWVDDWSQVTEVQEALLRDGTYANNCDTCEMYGTNRFEKFDQNLHSDYSNAIQMSGYWSLRHCHYNPVASAHYRSSDCETDMSYCSFDSEANMCLWKWSDDYGKCFTERETMWQILSGAQPAFTSIRQCREITNRTLKKRCRRAIIKQKKLRKRERQQSRRQEEEQNVENQEQFDLDLD